MIRFHSAAQWTLRPYLAQGPAAAISSQGWLSDASQQILVYRGQISLHNTATVMMHYQNSIVHAAAGLLEQIRNICAVKSLDNLHLEVLMGGYACCLLRGLKKACELKRDQAQHQTECLQFEWNVYPLLYLFMKEDCISKV